MAEAELQKPNMKSPANWAAPKAAHKRMMNRLLQCRAHIILCLRAEEKIRIEKVMDERAGREKTVVVHAGWQPICEKTTMFEMVVSFVMSPEHPGIPIECSGKIQDQHRFAFPPGKLVTRESGRLLAEWAAGGVIPEPAGAVPDLSLEDEARRMARHGNAALDAWVLTVDRRDKAKLKAIGAELRFIAGEADLRAAAATDDPAPETGEGDPVGWDAAPIPQPWPDKLDEMNWPAYGAAMVNRMRKAASRELTVLRKFSGEHVHKCPPSVMADIDRAYDARRAELQ